MNSTARNPVVVGASVAGALVALRLARAGVPCTVCESRRKPWAKVCGEGFHPSGRRALEEVLGDVSGLGQPLRGFRFTTATAELLALEHSGSQLGLGCDRLLLEQRLWRALAEHPLVEFRPGCAVVDAAPDGGGWMLATPDGPLAASHVVAADGVRSRLRSIAGRGRRRSTGRWGLRQRFCLARAAPSEVEVCFLDDGEVFLTPLGPRRLSVAVLGRERLVRALRDPRRLAGYLARMRAGFELAGAEPEEAPRIMPHRGRRAAPWCRGRLYLVGDAAAFLDPISGAGMTLAALSARVAAAAIADVAAGRIDDARAESAAEREMRRCVRPFRNLTGFLLLLARAPWFRRAAIPLLRRSPRMVGALARPTLIAGAPVIEAGAFPATLDREERAC